MSILSTIFKAKRYIKTDNGYQLFSEWQKASEVEFNNGSDAETTLGAINGITSSLNTNNDNYALSAAGGYNLQSQVTKLNTNLTTIHAYTWTQSVEARTGTSITLNKSDIGVGNKTIIPLGIEATTRFVQINLSAHLYILRQRAHLHWKLSFFSFPTLQCLFYLKQHNQLVILQKNT